MANQCRCDAGKQQRTGTCFRGDEAVATALNPKLNPNPGPPHESSVRLQVWLTPPYDAQEIACASGKAWKLQATGKMAVLCDSSQNHFHTAPAHEVCAMIVLRPDCL